MKTRTLKIEEAGDAHRYGIVPKLRISGKWFEAAGFKPGEHTAITILSPGVIEIRVSQPTQHSQAFQIAAMKLDHATGATL